MSGEIVVRTAYYERTNEVVRFWDWAKILYPGLGTAAEPFFVNRFMTQDADAVDGRENLNYANQMTMINHLENIDFDKLPVQVFGDGVVQLHGGLMYPRTGR
jgi:hypothetical protein